MVVKRNNILLAALLLLSGLFAGRAGAWQSGGVGGSDGSDRSDRSDSTAIAIAADSSRAFYACEGIASWYGRRFQGRKTASGERYNRQAMTCAHRSLPFGTKVKVTNVETGEQVIVRVNDRGPFVRHRIIDLSSAAADAIGIKGCARVRVEEISDTSEPQLARVVLRAKEHKAARKIVEEDTLPPIFAAVPDSTIDSVVEVVQPISHIEAHYHTAAEPLFARRAVAYRQCSAGVRIVDTNNVPIDVHGYSVVVAVTNRYADALAVREALLLRGYHDVNLLIANTCGENHYKVCVGVEPLPIACRRTAEFLVRDYPTTTILYINRVDDDQNQTAALTY